jgi:hypothetical protein
MGSRAPGHGCAVLNPGEDGAQASEALRYARGKQLGVGQAEAGDSALAEPRGGQTARRVDTGERERVAAGQVKLEQGLGFGTPGFGP